MKGSDKPNSIRHLVVITTGYPSPRHPDLYPFVRQFAHALARLKIKCTVIHPVAFHRRMGRKGIPYHSIEGDGPYGVDVYRPKFLSLSARAWFSQLRVFNPALVTLRNFTAAVLNTMRRHALSPDALYGHFLYLSGAAAVRLGEILKTPAFPGVGEDDFWTVKPFGKQRTIKNLKNVSGFISNSKVLKVALHDILEVPLDKIGVFPNGVDTNLFHPFPKFKAREKFSLPQRAFIVGCVGRYSNRKGQKRVYEAIKGLENTGIVFVGNNIPKNFDKNVFLSGMIPHDKVPEIISACDIFVLPTLSEGSCNAIIEAMACGLPIISSRGEFNDDLLADDMSIRVDPLNIDEIRGAILYLKNNPDKRKRMSEAALVRSRQFDINVRVKKIIQFMEKKVEAGNP